MIIIQKTGTNNFVLIYRIYNNLTVLILRLIIRNLIIKNLKRYVKFKNLKVSNSYRYSKYCE